MDQPGSPCGTAKPRLLHRYPDGVSGSDPVTCSLERLTARSTRSGLQWNGSDAGSFCCVVTGQAHRCKMLSGSDRPLARVTMFNRFLVIRVCAVVVLCCASFQGQEIQQDQKARI